MEYHVPLVHYVVPPPTKSIVVVVCLIKCLVSVEQHSHISSIPFHSAVSFSIIMFDVGTNWHMMLQKPLAVLNWTALFPPNNSARDQVIQ